MTDNQIDQPTDKMPTATHKSFGESTHAKPAFSYAQAAKGRSPSVPSSLPPSKALSDTTEIDQKRSLTSETRATNADSSKSSSKRTASEGRAPLGESSKANEDQKLNISGDTKASTNVSPSTMQPNPIGQSQSTTSCPSSPDFGTTSTSTLPKEEDMFSTVNGSSDSTSDKQSQTSQSGNKSPQKEDTEKEKSRKISWDEDSPTPALLKEAPPPAVNFWQQRREAQEAELKAKAKQSTSIQLSKSNSLNNGVSTTNSSTRGTESINELKKQDSKKKGKSGPGSPENRSTPGTVKDTSRSTEPADKSTATLMAPPPPPGDAISWPTPDTALGEGKKKSQELADKADRETLQAWKPHQKEKWVPVPFVPTAVFNTPLPQARRGGRAPRGGREGGARGGSAANASISTEKPLVGAFGTPINQTTSKGGIERARVLNSGTTNTNFPKPKRASSAGPTSVKEQRKPGDSTVVEKQKQSDFVVSNLGQENGSSANDLRRFSAATSTNEAQADHSFANPPVNEANDHPKKLVRNNTDGDKSYQNVAPDAQFFSRSSGPERRSEGSIRPLDFTKDNHGSLPPRERGEGRSDRGRGGLRGRGGGHHAFYNSNLPNGHGLSNGHPAQYQAPSGPSSKPNSNHEGLPPQSPGSAHSPPQHNGRNHRSNSRSQNISHYASYARFPTGHHGGALNLANIQTSLANEYGYQPGHQGIMSAFPYVTYEEQPSQFGMLTRQMEYYFSLENLLKDIYLRSHMDSQGFVFLSVLLKFNRIKQLADDIELIRYVCLNAPTIQFVEPDGVARVRVREGWQRWVLRMEERDPSAQNDGPQIPAQSQTSFGDRQGVSPRSVALGRPMENFQYQSLDGVPLPTFGQAAHISSSTTNPADASAISTPLSATVSEFTPSVRSTNTRDFPTLDPHAQATSVFNDQQVDNLHILVRKPMNAATPMLPPFHSSSSRTFSNGSIDGRSINDELTKFSERQPRSTVHGDASESVDLHNMQRSRSAFSLSSPPRQANNSVSPPVLWIKDKETPFNPLSSLPNELIYESYHVFRRDALGKREQSVPDKDNYDMQSLYQFWSHFLIRNFNPRMYQEFRQLAFEDASQRNSTTGMRSLIQYYDESILSQKTISDDNIARDFVELVKSESSYAERPAFTKLRLVWRNGAFNFKNRSKLSKIIDADLRAELER